MKSVDLFIPCGKSPQPVNRGHQSHPAAFVPALFRSRQVESAHANQRVWTMTDDDDDAWESVGEVIARLLRKIDPSREAA